MTIIKPAELTPAIGASLCSLLAIKGIYENGHITLEEDVATDQAIAVVVTFLTEKPTKIIAKTNWESWFASMSQFSDDFMADGREQPQAQDRWV